MWKEIDYYCNRMHILYLMLHYHELNEEKSGSGKPGGSTIAVSPDSNSKGA